MEEKDNFLDDTQLSQLDELINSPHFSWYLQRDAEEYSYNDSDLYDNGYWHRHLIYENNVPQSEFFEPLSNIFKNTLYDLKFPVLLVNSSIYYDEN